MNKKGFTLIELLAVIIILGILMIIAIPSVTNYINDSRKSAYVDTAKEIVSGTRNLVNEGKLGMYDTNTTYYIPASYISTENGLKSPYGEFTQAYVGVIYNGTGYKYYWISVDDTGQGIDELIASDKLSVDDIKSDLNDDDIKNKVKTTGIGNRSNIKILSSNGTWEDFNANDKVAEDIVCKKATTLHSTICQRDSYGCAAKIGQGNTITYGTIPSGSPKSGDAYDCDVNSDGIYDSNTERFYYVKSEGNKSILIYYTNMNGETLYQYYSTTENWHGPTIAYQYLPSTTEWNNPGLIAPGTRTFKNELGETTSEGHTFEPFTYTDKAARFLTKQEVDYAVGRTVRSVEEGAVDDVVWLMESVGYFELAGNGHSFGYWLETPSSSYSGTIWCMFVNMRGLSTYSTNTNMFGVRPVITIKTSDLES